MENMYTDIPTWDNGTWTTTSFDTRKEFGEFVFALFKEPGEYEFDDVSNKIFISESTKFNIEKVYCVAPFKSKDFINYWDDQKAKCRLGLIIKSGSKTWFLTRDYYMWLNFLPIFDKEEQKFGFAKIRDAQYHMALYEILAEINYMHVAILKKRQIASSYFHAGKLINQLWFEAGVTLKMGASLKDYINEKGTWKFLSEYAAFLNEHTAWYRPMSPDKVMMWQQKIEIRKGDRKAEIGLKGTMQGMSFEKDPTNGVGGPVKFFFHEEAGIAPKMDTTFGYIKPALKSGMITTGLFIAAGSVGDLDQCGPLKKMILDPISNDIYPVKTNLIDKDNTWGESGLFIPEQWSMPPYIDDYGNSLVQEALIALDEYFEEIKKNKEPKDYQLEVSQHPRNIEEAFAFRKEAKFPPHLVNAQIKRIEEKEYSSEFLDISRDETGKVKVKATNKLPIAEFPISKKTEDKTGTLVVWERPVPDPTFGMYYGSIDPVAEGKAEHVDNMLYTHFGRKRIGDVKIGDLITSSSGSITEVTGVFPQGIKKLYRVYFNDGHSVLVCDEHLWNVKLNGGTKDFITLSTKDLMDKNKKISYQGTGRNKTKTYTINTYIKDSKGRNKWAIPIIKNPVSFCTVRAENIQIDPYFLGLLLGDGGLSQKNIRFSSIDQEIIDYIKNILPKNVSIKKIKSSNCDYRISIDTGNKNPITKVLKNLELQGKRSEYKFIPDAYKYSNVEDRLALLQGLMDTDGSCTNNGSEFYSSSKTLAYDVVELVQSLGGIAKIRMKKTTHLDSYIVRVLLPEGICPFKLSRKKVKYKPSKVFSRYITDIKYEKDGEAVCISVDAEDQLYVTEHAIVTHNTTTSDSLCSIYIMKAPVEVTKVTNGEAETFIERDKIVAAWCGRFDDINKTHERLELIIEWYNAWTIVENNISQFINHMISRKKQRYLVPRNKIVFLKDLGSNANVFQEYGWRNTGVLFKNHMISYTQDFLTEEIDHIQKDDGTTVKIHYGVERIPDIMLLKEMQAYQDGLNVDRLVAFAALVSFLKIQQANMGYTKRIVRDEASKKLENSKNLYTLKSSPFRHMGRSGLGENQKFNRSPFKNLK